MSESFKCPKCKSPYLMFSKKRGLYVCEDCYNEFKPEVTTPSRLRIFMSYGHDQNEELVRIIKSDLEKRGHDVWFDKSGVKENGIIPGDDWRRAITEGIADSNRVLSFLSKHSTRLPGVCLDEISIAIGVKGGNIQTILVESETEVKAPPSISHIQWLDMHNWIEKKTEGDKVWQTWYQEKLKEIIEVIESDESRRFAGEIEKLSGYLMPISSDSRISSLLKKKFVGREWLTNAIEKWRTGEDWSSRLFWITGSPGVGKSAFSAHLSHYGKDKVIAVQFCEYDKADHRDACRVIRSLAFQIATRLPDYRKLLLILPEINTLDSKGAFELFDYLFVNPLKQLIEGGRERYLILIDALDEAKTGDSNPLVEMLARYAPSLPEWIGIVITSRPERNVTDPLQGLKPFMLDAETGANREDISLYIDMVLYEELINRPDAKEVLNNILEKSEGVFLYAERVCQDVKDGNLSLDNPENFPKGLGGIYLQFFQRQFPDLEKYRIDIRPVLRTILASQDPLPVHLLGKIFNWKHEENNDFIRLFGSLFPILKEAELRLIKPYHKSIIDWITEENTAGVYYVDLTEGHKLLADLGWQEFMQGPETMSPYFIKWLPRHLMKLKRWDDLVNLICNLGYIQEKAAAKLTYHLVEDFNQTLSYIPDNAENIFEENKHRAHLEKYTLDLIAYAKGEIGELAVPETMPLWNQEKISAEIERIRTRPTRLDRLKDFTNFLGQEASNLQNHAHEFPHFATQQAWNYAYGGSVGGAAEKEPYEVYKSLLLYGPRNRSPFNPFPQFIRTYKGHFDKVLGVSLTPDGQMAISGSWDHTCILWNLATGEILYTLKGHAGYVYTVSIAADKKRAISGSRDKTCIVWDLTTGQVIYTLKGHSDQVNAVSITPDGKLAISGSSDKTCILWDLNTGETIQILRGHTGSVNAITITPDGKLAVSGSSDNTCVLWDLTTGKAMQILKGHYYSVNAISITPDGQRAISGSGDNTCILWNLSTGESLQTLKGHYYGVYSVSITPDGKRAISGSSDSTCILWNLTTGEAIQSQRGHTYTVYALSISPDGRHAISGSSDNTCILWDLTTGEIRQTSQRHAASVNAISITSDGKRAISCGSWDKTCILWDLTSGEAIKIFKGHTSSVNDVIIAPDGKWAISGSSDNTCIVWDLTSGEVLKTLMGHTRPVSALSITPDGKRVLTCSEDKTCILWDLTTGKALQTLKGHTANITVLAITPDGQRAVSGSGDNTCILWDLITGKALKTLKGHTDAVTSLSITPDGKRAISGSLDMNWILWDLYSGEAHQILKGHPYKIDALTITPDGQRAILYGSKEKTCILWNLCTGSEIQIMKGHTEGVIAVSITPDGQRAISCGSIDMTCIIWNLENGAKAGLFVSTSNINVASFFPEGIFGGEFSGKTFIIKINKELTCPLASIVTVQRIWDFELQQYLPLSTNCPVCGHLFEPPALVLATIDNVSKKAGLKPEQSPCLVLPKEVWNEPGLLSTCPICDAALKYNPFVAVGDY